MYMYLHMYVDRWINRWIDGYAYTTCVYLPISFFDINLFLWCHVCMYMLYVYVTLSVMWSNTILEAYTTYVYPSICLFLCLILCLRLPLSIYLFDIMCLCMNVNLCACQYSFVRLLLSHIRTYMFTSEHARFDTCINTYVYTLELFIYEYNI